MSDDDPSPDLTADERALLDAAADPASAAEVLSEYDNFDEPVIVEEAQREAERAENREVREALAMQLTGDDFAAEALADQHDTATLKERLTDDGETPLAEALVQEPETGDTESTDDEAGAETLSDEDRDRIEQIDQKLSLMGSALPAERAAALREEAADLADTDDYEAALEVL